MMTSVSRDTEPTSPSRGAGDGAATLAARLGAVEGVLRIREGELRAFLEHTSDLVHVTDADGRLRYANRAWRRALGIGPGATGAPTIHAVLAPECHTAYESACRQVLADGRDATIAAILRAWDGTAVEVVGRLSRLIMEDGQEAVQGFFHDMTAQRFQAARADHIATHDPLTNLASHAAFVQYLPHALARSRRLGTLVAIALVDLDDFRHVNDLYGHLAGDRALIEIGDRLTRCVRAEDLVARLGGDRFALVLERIHEVANAQFVVERALTAITTPLSLPTGAVVRLRASIGVALSAGPTDEPGGIFQAAERATLAAKRAGGETHVFAERVAADEVATA